MKASAMATSMTATQIGLFSTMSCSGVLRVTFMGAG